ncbi:peptidoglycan-binding domain-containing protein [Paraglaciecola sp. L3A3]|uniref:peptidoglycan-binding domain-containing protein n=1 Tax=Paraglaciecola sp. L3A3 TaxID=2686358 RepID=UPI00131DCE14|nr:peptidoglycan-binding domain-containing protein [Paraglaciecola sp. L3A3]
MYRSLIVTIFCYCVFAAPLQAADKEGKFAVKGAGKRDCSSFVQAADDKSTDYYLYGGWLEGYISSYNAFQTQNYDSTPWQTTELLLTLLKRHCVSHPKVKFLSAVNGLLKTLYPIRLERENKLIKISVNGADTYFYEDILLRAKERLHNLGYITDEVTADFDEGDIHAFEKYQNDIGLSVTGVPDQNTLLSLFLKKVK